eukprot:5908385-Ditylum_brightwellii.AAC.1
MAEYLEKRNDPRWAMPAKAEMSMRVSYRPELDITPVLSLLVWQPSFKRQLKTQNLTNSSSNSSSKAFRLC